MFINFTAKVGKMYLVGKSEQILFDALFIKVTDKGYNFLNMRTGECVFKQHFYARKNENGLLFFTTAKPFVIKTFVPPVIN